MSKYKVGDPVKVIKAYGSSKGASNQSDEGALNSNLLNKVGKIIAITTVGRYDYRVRMSDHNIEVYESEIELVNKNNMVYRRGVA